MKRTYYTVEEIDQFITEHVLRGDRNDGIPNVLSPDNCIVDGVRQRKLTAGRMEALVGLEQASCDDETMSRIKRNRTLIDLRHIPQEISTTILEEYKNQAGKSRNKMFNYFVKFKLRNLLEDIGEF